MSVTEIDFVLLWVDGADERHKDKRLKYLQDFSLNFERNKEQSIDDRRFVQHDEIKYCLRSIKLYAPWYRYIFLVTDNQIPQFLDTTKLEDDRIKIIDHTELFLGDDLKYLPTFNSRALATKVKNIPGISEKFVLGNDDIMLSSYVPPEFFFVDENPIIYADWTSLEPDFTPTLWQQGILNGAEMLGFTRSKFLVPSHGFLPFNCQHLKQLENMFPEEFRNNLYYRFRHESQFLLESLYNHYCVAMELGVLKDTTPMVHFSFQLCRIGIESKIQFLCDLLKNGERKMLCVNEFQSLSSRLKSWLPFVESLCGQPISSEFQQRVLQ